MERYLASVLILCTIFSCSFSQSPYQPIPINTMTSRRIMEIAATRIGIDITREISASKHINYPWYLVRFEGMRGTTGALWTCRAHVVEPEIGRGYVTSWYCRWF